MYQYVETLSPGDLVYLLAPHTSSIHTATSKYEEDYVGPFTDTLLDSTHYKFPDLENRLEQSHPWHWLYRQYFQEEQVLARTTKSIELLLCVDFSFCCLL